MNKRFWISSLAVFVVWMAGSFLVHGLLLKSGYAQLPNLFRTDAETQQYFHFMLLAHVSMALAFTWIYARGVEVKPWAMQGLRFGLVVAFLTAIPTYAISYVVQPLPGMHVLKQMLFDGALLLVLGCVVAFFYRDGNRA